MKAWNFFLSLLLLHSLRAFVPAFHTTCVLKNRRAHDFDVNVKGLKIQSRVKGKKNLCIRLVILVNYKVYSYVIYF